MQKKYLITQIFLLYAKHILKCISAAITRICVVRYVRFYTRWHRRENDQFSTLRCTKTGSTQPKLSAACFVVQSCLADADFVVSSNYCLIGTRRTPVLFFIPLPVHEQLFHAALETVDGQRVHVHRPCDIAVALAPVAAPARGLLGIEPDQVVVVLAEALDLIEARPFRLAGAVVVALFHQLVHVHQRIAD